MTSAALFGSSTLTGPLPGGPTGSAPITQVLEDRAYEGWLNFPFSKPGATPAPRVYAVSIDLTKSYCKSPALHFSVL